MIRCSLATLGPQGFDPIAQPLDTHKDCLDALKALVPAWPPITPGGVTIDDLARLDQHMRKANPLGLSQSERMTLDAFRSFIENGLASGATHIMVHNLGTNPILFFHPTPALRPFELH